MHPIFSITRYSMNRKFTFLLVIATLLMALSIQAQNVRQAFKKSVATSAKILGKPGELKGAQKKLTAQELKAAKKMGDVKRKKSAKRRNIVFRDVTPVDRTVPYDAYFADSDEAMSDFIVLNNNNDESDGEPYSYNIYADGQLVASVDASELSYSISDEELTDGEHTFAVTAIYTIAKESRPATATITIATDISQIATEKFVDVYSIDGKLLRRQATTLEGLKGIYIVNGKAVMVK